MVAIEIEAKMRVGDLDAVRARLRALGAQPRGSTLETNTFFDTQDKSLLAADAGLRLRKSEDRTSHEVSFKITFKGARRPGELKSREELELGVQSGADAAALLERLGFLRDVSFEKRRESWLLDGCHVELDSLPYLGTFVEIEGPGEQVIMDVRRKLDLADHPLEKNSYISMLTAHLRDRGETVRSVKFDGKL